MKTADHSKHQININWFYNPGFKSELDFDVKSVENNEFSLKYKANFSTTQSRQTRSYLYTLKAENTITMSAFSLLLSNKGVPPPQWTLHLHIYTLIPSSWVTPLTWPPLLYLRFDIVLNAKESGASLLMYRNANHARDWTPTSRESTSNNHLLWERPQPVWVSLCQTFS